MSPAPRPLCTIRPGKPDDLAFVADSWTKHAHRGERKASATKHVRALLSRSSSYLSVAHVPGEPDAILGWVVVEDANGPWTVPVIHYVYVRASGRRQGVARTLLAGLVARAVEYSSRAKGIALPAKWTLNEVRAETMP